MNAATRCLAASLLAILLRLVQPPRAAAENKVEYRYEDYNEDNGRIHIRTHSVGFEQELTSKVTAKGLLVYDGISGATPTGEPPALRSTEVPLANITDIRRALSLDLSVRYNQRGTFTPQFSYSQESDYTSRGVSLTHTYEFNQKNTTLVLGAAHNFDSVGGGVLTAFQQKGTTDFLVGVNQLLSPETVLTVNFSLGYADGYLNDPYRRATFLLPDSPDPIFSDPAQVNAAAEIRPRHRFKQIGYVSLTQFIAPLNASIEGSYRPYHDDWGIWSHTLSIQWNQMLGQRVTLSPLFRYYHQSAADFYAASFRGVSFDDYASGTRVAFQDGTFIGFQGDPSFPAPGEEAGFQIVNVPARPAYYSADYRLSEFDAFTFGLSAQIKICQHFTFDLAYKRYEMHGLDRATPHSVYPSAHIFTIGCGVWF
ncbi:MAG: DUF3570 domain-containing protein [Verrucomicrobia bacterium]|nr:DUF3570 domain-containing protein [Verrucomicrobiota bacterium]